MPVVKRGDTDSKPDRVSLSSYGVFTLKKGQNIELHYHDCNECWLIIDGRARIVTEGVEYDVGPSDLVCTKMGDEHTILEIYNEEFRGIYLEDELNGKKRKGHLHRGTDD